jgi:hypothetical protein
MGKQELLDILTTQDITALGGGDERQTLTVDTSLVDVPLDSYAFPQGTLRPGNALANNIPLGEGIIVQSIGISLPYSFGMSTQGFRVELYAKANITVSLFSSSLDVEIPFSNYEMSIGVFVPFPVGITGKYQIIMNIITTSAKVAMVNAPAALNGLQLPVISFAKISHTRPLTV